VAVAAVHFPLDVGVRRIQLEREEMQRMWQWIRRRVFFWAAVEREPEAEESLAALLSRRDQVRSTHTTPAAPPVQPSADLFRPQKPVTLPLDAESSGEKPGSGLSGAPPPVAEPEKPKTEASTTSRLLDAKRRAQQRKKE
jgi:hypothetical protein